MRHDILKRIYIVCTLLKKTYNSNSKRLCTRSWNQCWVIFVQFRPNISFNNTPFITYLLIIHKKNSNNNNADIFSLK